MRSPILSTSSVECRRVLIADQVANVQMGLLFSDGAGIAGVKPSTCRVCLRWKDKGRPLHVQVYPNA